MKKNSHWFFFAQIVGLVVLLWVGATALLIGGALLVLAYSPILMKDKLKNGTDGERMFVLVMIFGWAYVIYKILQAKGFA